MFYFARISKMDADMKRKPSNLESNKELISFPRKETLPQLNEYRLSNHLCDVILVSGGRDFPAHRAVLAAGGGFFRGLFAANTREQNENKINLPHVHPDVMDDILGFIYTGQIKVTQENAQHVIMAADFLLLEELKRPVDKFLARVFQDCPPSLNDCASLVQFTDQFNCYLLKQSVLKQLSKNFGAFLRELPETFLELNAPTIEAIISSDDVVVSGEEAIYQAVMKWIRHKKDREQFLGQMLSHLRWCALSQNCIQSDVLNDVLVTSQPDTIKSIQNAMHITQAPTTPNVPHPRDCVDPYTDAIIVIPQEYRSQNLIDMYICDEVWCYIPSLTTWYSLPTPSIQFGNGLPAYFEGSVITAFHFFELNKLNVEKYDINTNSWSFLVDGWEQDTVWNFRKAMLKGSLYLIGGKRLDDGDDSEELVFPPPCEASDYVFACNLRSNSPSFKQVSSMNIGREHPCVVSDEKYIYALGGTTYPDGFERLETDTMERYNPESDSWSFLSPVGFCTVSNGSAEQCTIANDKIFVIPEKENQSEITFGLMYNISTDTWSKIPPAPLSASYGCLTHCHNKLYLMCAGLSDTRQTEEGEEDAFIKTVTYDLKENMWSEDVHTTELQISKVGREFGDGDSIVLAGTVVRLKKDFLSTLEVLQHIHHKD